MLRVAGVERRPRSPSRSARRPTWSTRTTCAPGPADFAEAFAGWQVYYAGKSFLCTAVARWVAEEGLGVDVCTGGELAVALRAGVDPRRDRPARQQQERRGARGRR